MESDAETRFIDIFKVIFDLSLTRKDLRDLKPDIVQQIYSHFLRDFGANVAMMHHFPHGTSDNILTNQGMYQSCFNIMALSKTIQYYMKLISPNENFFLSDLIQPNKNRTHKFFMIFIDFYSYLNEHLPTFGTVREEVMEKKEMKRKLTSSMENYKRLLKTRLTENAEIETALDEELIAIRKATLEMEAARGTKEKLKFLHEERKDELQSKKVRIKEQELCLMQYKEECSALESLCVTDEEKAQICDMESELFSRGNSLQNLKDAFKENQKNLEMITKAEKLISKSLLPLVMEIEEEARKIPKTNSSLQDRVKSLSDIMEEDEELMRKLQDWNEEIATLQEKRSTLQHSSELKKLGFTEELKQLKLTVKEINQGNEENHIIMQDLTSEIESLKVKITQEFNQLNDYKREIKSWVMKLSSQIEGKDTEMKKKNELKLTNLRL